MCSLSAAWRDRGSKISLDRMLINDRVEMARAVSSSSIKPSGLGSFALLYQGCVLYSLRAGATDLTRAAHQRPTTIAKK